MRDIETIRAEVAHQHVECQSQPVRRITLIAATVERHRGIGAHLVHHVVGILEEHLLVFRIGAVVGICQPEVLPYHDAMTVAGLVEFLVAYLSHPVAHHVQVHVAVVAQGDVVVAGRIVEVYLTEPPVAAVGDEAPTVDKQLNGTVLQRVVHLPYAAFHVLFS